MKTIWLSLFLSLCLSSICVAQSGTSSSKIFMQVLQPERDNIPLEAAKQLETKLTQLLSANGIADTDPINRFVITTKALILTKEIVPGPPAKVSMNVEFVFMIGDVVENKVFETFSITSVGVGINENKAMIAAIKNVKPKNPEMVAFLNKAKDEIVEYYSLRCIQIKKEAEKDASKGNYDKAIYALSQIPDVCDCYADCQDLAIKYNRSRVIANAASLLNKAKAKWAESPNANGAAAAADLLRKIPGGTTSQNEIDALLNDITQKLKADEKKEWDFKMQQYKDQVEKQKRDEEARLEQQRADSERRAAQQAANNAARIQAIEACRQVGLEYARNQPKSITYQRNVIIW